GDAFVDGGEEFTGDADGSGEFCARVIDGEGKHGRDDRVAEFFGDAARDFAGNEGVASVDVLRTALLSASVVYDGGGFAGFDGVFNFGPGHHVEFDGLSE